ncbi:hypothetical protein G7Y79_00008g025070 [Physcia stellaris]|nr:hypothetical protein G7Y79_00008g025070 [Physcia stellaris]
MYTTPRDKGTHWSSVFESEFDNTQRENRNSGHQRWKYRGPWIAGQTAGEFKNYTERIIKNRKTEFRQFMRERLGERIAAADRRAAIDNGLPLPDQPPVIDEQRLDHHIKELRQEQQQGRLFELIEEFLDLPSGSNSSRGDSKGDTWVSSESGPPATHPSAGLSYHRAPSHTFNHPAFGPQNEGQPIRARVLVPRTPTDKRVPRFGVGGVTVEEPTIRNSDISQSTEASKGSAALDQDIPGGPKIWVHPDQLTVDPEGRIKVRTKIADPKTTAIYESSEREPQELTPDPLANADRRLPDLTKVASHSSGNTKTHHTYGVNNNSGSALATLPRISTGAKPLEKPKELINLIGGLDS